MHRLKSRLGYTIIELLTAMIITGVLAAASFKFYIAMHGQTLAQEEISTMQQNSRICIAEISRSLRMAGYKTGTHPAYSINGDSLYVFYSDTQPIDSVLYYTADYSDAIQATFPDNITPKMLMKKINSDAASVYADYILDLNYNLINSSTIEIGIDAIVSETDDSYADNEGYRTLTSVENVNMRNVSL